MGEAMTILYKRNRGSYTPRVALLALWAVFLGLVLLRGAPARAEADIDLTIEHSAFLQFEPTMVFVSVKNDSIYPMEFGPGDNDIAGADLRFHIARYPKGAVTLLDTTPMALGTRFQPGEKQEFMFDLSRLYDIGTMGRYLVTAAIETDEAEMVSRTLMFDVVRGIELRKVSRSLPAYPARLRDYSLRYWRRAGNEHLFLCVEEAKAGYSYGVFPLGRMIRLRSPDLEVDREGKITVTHQAAHDRFLRSTFHSTPDSVDFIDQQYLHTDGRPYVAENPTE